MSYCRCDNGRTSWRMRSVWRQCQMWPLRDDPSVWSLIFVIWTPNPISQSGHTFIFDPWSLVDSPLENADKLFDKIPSPPTTMDRRRQSVDAAAAATAARAAASAARSNGHHSQPAPAVSPAELDRYLQYPTVIFLGLRHPALFGNGRQRE